MQSDIYPSIREFIEDLDQNELVDLRREMLQPVIDYGISKLREGRPMNLNYICTHNSRRSQFTQIWAACISSYYGLTGVNCYSGGTEATALYGMVSEVLKQCGFRLNQMGAGNNPIYFVKFSHTRPPSVVFSKEHGNFYNPESGFAAVMVCSDADTNCPNAPGADRRFYLPYKDPGDYDTTEIQAEKYRECSQIIATEMKYLFSSIKNAY
ncbi:MAG: protein-tyrosine-phosphatase [Saprospirales bacterium]|nr:MAG: protein-tyrosine-phosphatase [Saprospirales bacterium]